MDINLIIVIIILIIITIPVVCTFGIGMLTRDPDPKRYPTPGVRRRRK